MEYSMLGTSVCSLLMLPQSGVAAYTHTSVWLAGSNHRFMHMDMENLHAHRPKSAEITMQTLATDDERGMLMPVRTQSYRSLRSFWVRVLSTPCLQACRRCSLTHPWLVEELLATGIASKYATNASVAGITARGSRWSERKSTGRCGLLGWEFWVHPVCRHAGSAHWPTHYWWMSF